MLDSPCLDRLPVPSLLFLADMPQIGEEGNGRSQLNSPAVVGIHPLVLTKIRGYSQKSLVIPAAGQDLQPER